MEDMPRMIRKIQEQIEQFGMSIRLLETRLAKVEERSGIQYEEQEGEDTFLQDLCFANFYKMGPVPKEFTSPTLPPSSCENAEFQDIHEKEPSFVLDYDEGLKEEEEVDLEVDSVEEKISFELGLEEALNEEEKAVIPVACEEGIIEDQSKFSYAKFFGLQEEELLQEQEVPTPHEEQLALEYEVFVGTNIEHPAFEDVELVNTEWEVERWYAARSNGQEEAWYAYDNRLVQVQVEYPGGSSYEHHVFDPGIFCWNMLEQFPDEEDYQTKDPRSDPFQEGEDDGTHQALFTRLVQDWVTTWTTQEIEPKCPTQVLQVSGSIEAQPSPCTSSLLSISTLVIQGNGKPYPHMP